MPHKEKKKMYVISLGEDKKFQGKHFVNVLYLWDNLSNLNKGFFGNKKLEKDKIYIDISD